MKQTGKLMIAGAILLAMPSLQAQGLLNMFKKKEKNTNTSTETVKKPVMANPYTKDFTDDLGFSGTYFALDTIWLNEYGGYWFKDGYAEQKVDDKGNPYFVTTLKLGYQREMDDNVVNLMGAYYSEFSSAPEKTGPRLDEKMQKLGTVLFSSYPSANQRYTWAMIDKDVVAFIFSGDNFEKAQVLNVFAKDKTMLETYDKETSLAKFQQVLRKVEEQKYAKIKEDLMKNDTYAKMKGKVGFVTHYNQTGASYGKISESMDAFISSVEIGKPFYWRAYYDVVPSSKCGDGCTRNMIFEIEGQKVSYMELRKKSSTWSSALSKMNVDNDFFSMCPTMIEGYVSNWALVYCIYLNKDKLSEGKSLKCKVTITNHRDGVDQDILAEGVINLVYKSANQSQITTLFEKVEKLDQ